MRAFCVWVLCVCACVLARVQVYVCMIDCFLENWSFNCPNVLFYFCLDPNFVDFEEFCGFVTCVRNK